MLAFVSDTGIVVAVIAFVALFGASQIPKLARNLGEAGREFRKAHAELTSATPAEAILSAAAIPPVHPTR
jgi:TatA/E family protein of Tat protein translocase